MLRVYDAYIIDYILNVYIHAYIYCIGDKTSFTRFVFSYISICRVDSVCATQYIAPNVLKPPLSSVIVATPRSMMSTLVVCCMLLATSVAAYPDQGKWDFEMSRVSLVECLV